MKRTLLGSLSACLLTVGLAIPGTAHAVPIILSDAEAGAVCDFAMAGADVYLFVGTWPNQVIYRYVCDGNDWVIAGTL
jgi:hypothetical protein